MIELPVWPGLIAVIYFLFLDLILLTILDSSLARLLSGAYHRRIQRGQPMLMSSCDVPGVTNFQLGKRFLTPNLIALLVKVLALAIIIALEWNINDKFDTSYSTRKLHGTYAHDPSQLAINGVTVTQRKVQRLWDMQRLCRRADDKGRDNVTFYHLAYNLENDEKLESEIMDPSAPVVYINETSVVCMAPDAVEEPWALRNVSGCSKRGENKPCMAENPVSASMGDLRIDNESEKYTFTFFYFFRYKFFLRQFTQDEVLSILPAYRTDDLESMDMVCMIAAYKVGGPVVEQRSSVTTCLTTRILKTNQTIMEWWIYDDDRNEITSPYAGAVFEGKLDIGFFAKAAYIRNLQRAAPSYITLAAVVVAETLVYQVADREVSVAGTRRGLVVLPVQAIVLICVMTVGVIAVRITAALAASHKKVITIKPKKDNSKTRTGDNKEPLIRTRVVELQQINAISGLSDIAHKEVAENSGGTRAIGRHRGHIDLGLTMNKKGQLHFGPLVKKEEAVKMMDGAQIV